MKITLPNHKATSWNKIYASRHWITRKQIADKVHLEVRGALNQLADSTVWALGTMDEIPRDITITAYFKNRPIDSDNICSKLFIDGLKGWLIQDDTPEYVRRVTTQSVVDKTLAEPRVEIEILEAA